MGLPAITTNMRENGGILAPDRRWPVPSPRSSRVSPPCDTEAGMNPTYMAGLGWCAVRALATGQVVEAGEHHRRDLAP